MKIPKIISKNNHEYIFVKEYPNFVMITHCKECFKTQDLGLVKEIVKPPKADLNVEKVKF